MIHRFVDIFKPCVHQIVFLAFEQTPSFYHSLWKAGPDCPPVPFQTTRITAPLGNDWLGDPELSPDGTEVVYSRVGHNLTPKKNSVRKVDWDDTTNVELYSETGGAQQSLQPTWKPDGTKILFRAKNTAAAPAPLTVIKHMNSDGTGVTTLYTGATTVVDPLYSYDGTKIGFSENGNIKVMNADGTGLATIHSDGDASNISWANTQNVLAYVDVTGSPGWRKRNADGTGLTTLSTSWTFQDVIPIKWSWMPDDSAIVTTLRNAADPTPNWHLVKIAADGSGTTAVSPPFSTFDGFMDSRPVVMNNRIYLPDQNANHTILSSVALDGSDYRVEFDGTVLTPAQVVFHGFKGDSVNT